MSQNEKSKQKNRSNAPVIAGLVGCFLSVYGFSHQNPILTWMVPLGLVTAAVLWAWWPRSSERSKPTGGA